MKISEIFQNKYLVILFAVAACLLWGSAFPFVKIGYTLFNIGGGDTYPKILFAGYRFLLAGLLILAFSAATKQSLKLTSKGFKEALILGFFMTAIQYTFFYIGLSNTTGVKGAILNSTSVFFTLLLAHFLLTDDALNPRKAIGLLLGFTGVILINYSPQLLRFDYSFKGEGYLLIAQISGALGGIYLKKISSSASVVVLTAYQMIFGSLLLIFPTMIKTGAWPFEANLHGILLLLYLAFLSATAFSLWNTLVKYNLVGKLAMYKFLIPVFGVLLSGLFLAENITALTLVALVVVSSAIVVVNGSFLVKAGGNKEAKQ